MIKKEINWLLPSKEILIKGSLCDINWCSTGPLNVQFYTSVIVYCFAHITENNTSSMAFSNITIVE